MNVALLYTSELKIGYWVLGIGHGIERREPSVAEGAEEANVELIFSPPASSASSASPSPHPPSPHPHQLERGV